MPHIQISLPHGRFDAVARRSLVERLTPAVLAAEGVPDTPTTRALTWIVVDESGPAAWSVAAQPVEDRAELHAFARITTLASLLDPAKRAALVAAVNREIVEAAGGDPLGGLGIWVVIDEIPDGSWAIAGNPIGLADVRAVNARPAA